MAEIERIKFTEIENIHLKYTICFCRRGDSVLMVYRENEPNKGLWNGLGGKIEAGENPLDSVKREMLEEAEINLQSARGIHYAGIVTWNQEQATSSLGMYAFVADLPDDWPIWEGNKPTVEGALSWKPINWASDINNTHVVENIPHFLPPMLRKDPPTDYHFEYQGKDLTKVTKRKVPQRIAVLRSNS